MPRVPSDPAQIIVNHASFRVRLGAASTRALGLDDTAKIPVVQQHPGRRRAAPVVWSGQIAPGEQAPAAGGSPIGELLQAVRRADPAAAATQVLPRVDETAVLPPAVPTVVGQRSAPPDDAPVVTWTGGPRGRYGGGQPAAYAEPAGHGTSGPHAPGGPRDDSADRPGEALGEGLDGDEDGRYGPYGPEDPDGMRTDRRTRGRRGEPVKHAWYPHRRMNLGIVLLPLRIFLGFVCIYAGMGKLCDRVYFDGGKRGSMVTWLSSLHPWGLAEPLRDAALDHPVGAGLSIAFLQVVVGVLTVCGLWQRVAAFFGACLSIALLVTVSWRTVPVYDAPDFIYLAAWSPLVIAGAPVYSIDGHLAGDAWRRLGPRVDVWDLRRRVLRRGTVMATVIIGLTLVVGSVLGAAVRATSPRDDVPGPTVVPTNNLPGEPLPEVTSGDGGKGTPESPKASRPADEPTPSARQRQTTQPPATSHRPHPSTGGASAPRSTGGGSTGTPRGSGTASSGSSSGSGSGSGSGSATGGGGSQPPATSAETQAPTAPQATTKPPQGAIGGLLG